MAQNIVFRKSDLLADIDAYNITPLLDIYQVDYAIKLYYVLKYKTRYDRFTNDYSNKQEFSDQVYVYTKYKYRNLFIWPLYDKNNKVVKEQAKGACRAFVDYIWEKK